MVRTTTRLLGLLCALVVVLAAGTPAREAKAVTAPVIDGTVTATLVAGEITLTGSNFGSPATGALRFAFDGTTLEIPGASPNVSVWSDNTIVAQLTPDVRAGTLSVIQGDVPSAGIELLVYEYTTHSTYDSQTPDSLPLALAVDPEGTLWINQEFHHDLKSMSNDDEPQLTSIAIPQLDEGVFVALGDNRTGTSTLGEDIAVQSDGSIWFTQGGGYLYNGALPNASRIVRLQPDTQEFSCFNVPTDNAEVIGLAIDEASGVLWYAEAGLHDGNAISRFVIEDAASDCLNDPYVSPGSIVCEGELLEGCHQRFALPQPFSSPAHLELADDGSIWFTEFWATRVGALNPETGAIREFPLPEPIVQAGPGIYAGSGPWELRFDDGGNLWINEYFDATILRIDASDLDDTRCESLDATGTNPCIEEVLVRSDGTDLATIHTVAVGSDDRVWFGDDQPNGSRIGFIDAGDPTQVVMLPMELDGSLAGIVEDRSTGDVWFAEFEAQRIGRLRITFEDGDSIVASIDNCPNAYNPAQDNFDGDRVSLQGYRAWDDLTWPNSDLVGDACDDDADNDDLPDEVEVSLPGPECSNATGPTSLELRDTDGDFVLDGAECRLGTDPVNPTSKPSMVVTGDRDRDGLPDVLEAQLGTSPVASDTDVDGVHDGLEVRSYASDPLSADTDDDSCPDGMEVVSVNADRYVNSMDLVQIALSFGISSSSRYVPHFDLNRDGRISSIDLGMVAVAFGPCPKSGT